MPIHVISGIWQGIGWNSIIYLAALSGIDQEQYEAASIDGANRLQQVIHITLPGLMPTITILFILRMGNILNVGYEKILLLYNPGIYETADVISTYMYRYGLLGSNYGVGAAVGVFNTLISLLILVTVNTCFKRFTEDSLW